MRLAVVRVGLGLRDDAVHHRRPLRSGTCPRPIRPTASPRRRRRRSRSRRRRLRRASAPARATIDSSIWVATITGLPALRQARTMRFWIAGTCSGGSSTPRSPRATITASVRRRSRRAARSPPASPAWRMMPARPADQPASLGDVLGPLHEGQRDPVDAQRRGRRRGPRGPSRSAPRSAARTPGTLTPLRSDSGAADRRRAVSAKSAPQLLDAQPQLAVVEQQLGAGAAAPRRSPDAAAARASASPGLSRSRSRRKRRAGFELRPGRRRRCRRAASGPAGRAARRSAGRRRVSIARMMSQRALVVLVRAVAEVEPEHVGAGAEQRLDGLRVGAGGPEGGDDLGVAVAAHAQLSCASCAPRRSTRMARKSLTLVSVGPVTTESPSASKKPWPSLSARRALASMPLRPGARQRVGRDDGAGDVLRRRRCRRCRRRCA